MMQWWKYIYNPCMNHTVIPIPLKQRLNELLKNTKYKDTLRSEVMFKPECNPTRKLQNTKHLQH